MLSRELLAVGQKNLNNTCNQMFNDPHRKKHAFFWKVYKIMLDGIKSDQFCNKINISNMW